MTRSTSPWHIFLTISLLTLFFVTPLARAADGDDTERAKRHFNLGVSFYKDGDLDAALAEFDKAYETRQDFRVLYNIGQVQTERHDNAAAVKVLREYLRGGGNAIDAERRAAVEKTVKELSLRVGSVTVIANVTGAEVLVDGVSVALVPLVEPLAINAGVREIGVRKGTQLAPSRRITVAGGDTVRLEFFLETTPGSEQPLRVATERTQLIESAAARTSSPTRTSMWVAYGVAAAFGAGTATFALLARTANKDLDATLNQFPGNPDRIDHDRTRLKRWSALSDGFAAATLVTAGIGTYFLVSDHSSEPATEKRQSANLTVLPSGAVVSWFGSF